MAMVLSLLTSLVPFGGNKVNAEIMDRVVATVGKEVILQSEIVSEISYYLAEVNRVASSEAEFSSRADTLFKNALEQAIDSKILLREALLAGLEVTDERVEAGLEDFRKPYPSREAFLKVLEEAGETIGDLRTHVRKQILAFSIGMNRRRQFEAGDTLFINVV